MNKVYKILIIGAGFAGVWSALSAMRHLYLLKKQSACEITVINKDAYHGLRPRFYESDLRDTRILLDKIFTPFGIQYRVGEVIRIDQKEQYVEVRDAVSIKRYEYDRLILAAGSCLSTPEIPGLKQYGFNVDTYDAAFDLNQHLQTLSQKKAKGRYTSVVVGGGFTGIEVATELITRLKQIAKNPNEVRVIILDRQDIGHTLGKSPQQVALRALAEVGIEIMSNVQVNMIEKDHLILQNGRLIKTQTVIWTAGMRANPLAALFPVVLDPLGRLRVDRYLRIEGVQNCFAAGDVALAMTDASHPSLLMCQHAIPQGRYAGHNSVSELFSQPLLAYEQKTFVSIIDLGAFGALYAQGWDLKLIHQGQAAKAIKQFVNHKRIYPVDDGNIKTLMAQAEPLFKPMSFK